MSNWWTYIKTMVHRSKYTLFWNVSKRKLKNEYTISPRTIKKDASQEPCSALHFKVWARYFRHRYSLKTKWIQRLLIPINVFWKDLMLYWLNLILNSNQGLVLLRQGQIFRSTKHKILQTQNNEAFLYS